MPVLKTETDECRGSGCYRAYGVEFEGTVTLSEVNGSDVQDEVEESKCKLDWGAMSADGSVEYTILGSWELTQGRLPHAHRLRWSMCKRNRLAYFD